MDKKGAKVDLKEFFQSFGLYKKIVVLEDYRVGDSGFVLPHDFLGQTFEYRCKKENGLRTFEVELDPAIEDWYGQIGGHLPENLFVSEKLDFSFRVVCKCRSCKTYHIDLLLHVFSDIAFPKNLTPGLRLPVPGLSSDTSNGEEKVRETFGPKIYLEKIGAFPPIKVEVDPVVSKYFDRESNKWYYKALNCINENYGIGAFSYLRRIIEKELIGIIENIQTLPSSNSLEIAELLKKHKENPYVSTIYENIFQYLPYSLKTIGDNPIKFLYKQTSEGLHSLSEEECLKRSDSIVKILNFTILKLNEEKSQIKDLREIIKNLR